MTTMAASNFVPDGADPEVELAANMLHAALTGIPEAKRQAAAARLVQLLTPPKTPQRGGPILENVVKLFKEQKRDWSAADVVAALATKGKPAEPKKVYSALTYLKDMKVIRRVGYGRYLLADGSMVITHERRGD